MPGAELSDEAQGICEPVKERTEPFLIWTVELERARLSNKPPAVMVLVEPSSLHA
jgi:hypothetical protein